MIKVSVVIPAYNAQNYLNRCLDSIINQTLKELEIIVVNDGSTDDSLNILNRYKIQDNRIKIINQENSGTGISRNNGIKIAKGEYIAFVDADDYIELDMFKNLYQKAIEYQSDIVLSRYKRVNEFGKTISKSPIIEHKTKENIFKKLLNSTIPSVSCNAIYKNELFKNEECFFPNKNIYNEDTATLYKLYYFANSVRIVDEIYYNWHFTTSSKTNSITKKHLSDILEVLEMTKEFLQRHNIYQKYKKEFIQSVLRFILKKKYQIINYENDNAKQIFMMKTFLDMYCKTKYLEKDELIYIKEKAPSLYYRTLYEILILVDNHKILSQFEKKDIDKIKSILNTEFGLMQFSLNYIEKFNIEKIYIYGAGEIFKKLFPFLVKKGLKITAIIDNNIKSFQEYKVDKLENIIIKSNSHILVTSIVFSDEITKKLQYYSYKNKLSLNIISLSNN